MIITDTWWEDVFEGHLSLGLNKERLDELEDENFLYFEEKEVDHESLL